MTMRRPAILGLVAARIADTWRPVLAQPTATPPASKIVRLYAVRTEFDAGLLDGPLRDFEAQSGLHAKPSTAKDS